MVLRELHSILKSGAVYGLAGYGIGTLTDKNPILCAKVAAIYGLAIVIILHTMTYTNTYSAPKFEHALLGSEAIAILAARALNLIGNKAMAALGTYALVKYAISYYKW